MSAIERWAQEDRRGGVGRSQGGRVSPSSDGSGSMLGAVRGVRAKMEFWECERKWRAGWTWAA
jgi:hypothetical protein